MWTAVAMAGAPVARANHASVWTGSEMIVWGGSPADEDPRTGGRYDPASDAWRSMSTSPRVICGPVVVWTGRDMIVWGAEPDTIGSGSTEACPGTGLGLGYRYDADADAWAPVTTSGAPRGSGRSVATWTGSEMLVWGGADFSGDYDTDLVAGRYDPVVDEWTSLSAKGAREGRNAPASVWTGSDMIVWGGYRGTTPYEFFTDGGRYDAAADRWAPLPTEDAPAVRVGPAVVWTGSEMIVWGGIGLEESASLTGGRFNVEASAWVSMTPVGAPRDPSSNDDEPWGVEYSLGVWSGSEMIVWGGRNYGPAPDGAPCHCAGGRYDPALDQWASVSTDAMPAAYRGFSVVWTGSELIVWGGYELAPENAPTARGWRYAPPAEVHP